MVELWLGPCLDLVFISDRTYLGPCSDLGLAVVSRPNVQDTLMFSSLDDRLRKIICIGAGTRNTVSSRAVLRATLDPHDQELFQHPTDLVA